MHHGMPWVGRNPKDHNIRHSFHSTHTMNTRQNVTNRNNSVINKEKKYFCSEPIAAEITN